MASKFGGNQQIRQDASEPLRQLENKLPPDASNAINANLNPISDMFGRMVAYSCGFGNGGQICYGCIIDGSATNNCYRVNIERGTAPKIAIPLMGTSQANVGATEINTYAPGSHVLLYIHSQLKHAFILGVIPNAAVIGRNSVHDAIALTSRFRVDEAHKHYTKLDGGSGMANWNGWKPFDNTQVGEWGATGVTGLKITLDDFMVQMAVNEFTGVFGFYHDQMLRVAGYNMQTWTAGHERDAYMDQAEYNDTQGYSPYPWEAMGVLKPGVDIIQTYTPDQFATAAGRPYYSNWENKYDSQQPFHRTQKFYGYYGQGGRTVVCAPPAAPTWWAYRLESRGEPPDPFETTVQNKLAQDLLTASKGQKKETPPTNIEDPINAPIGLSEDNTAMDGRRFIASAKGITLAKRMLLPVPARMRRPEDGNGDDADTNYMAAGKYGNGTGKAHTITGDVATTEDKLPHLQRAAGILDLHGYLFNYVGLHPFHWHAKDYRTYEQSELTHAQYNSHIPDYTALKGSMYLPQPAAKSLDIDHRYTGQQFYESESYISLLEDGAVVIGDGYGAEIRMCGGSITFSAPGDVWFKPGKNAQIWAGRDIIMRAHDGLDMSTTSSSVRIKAEQNVMILAGNDSSSKQGGVLIESRAKAPTYNFEDPGDAVVFGGVVLRAKSSEIIGLGKNIYMRTTGGYNGTGDQAGVITLDASRGDGNIVTKSRNMYQYVDVDGGVFQHFRNEAAPGSARARANVFKRGQTLLGSSLFVNGAVAADGKQQGFAFIARGSFITDKGTVITQNGGPAVPCQGDCRDSVEEAINKIKNYAEVELPKALGTLDKEIWSALWYDKNRPGNSDTIKKFEFSFRRDEDYGVDTDFVMFEDRWQQYARIGEQETGTWEEKPVTVGGGATETWPFPGKSKMTDAAVFKQQDFSIVEYDGTGFRDRDRNSGSGDLADAYKMPQFKSVVGGKSLKDGYMIIKRS